MSKHGALASRPDAWVIMRVVFFFIETIIVYAMDSIGDMLKNTAGGPDKVVSQPYFLFYIFYFEKYCNVYRIAIHRNIQ